MLKKNKLILPITLAAFMLSSFGQMEAWSLNPLHLPGWLWSKCKVWAEIKPEDERKKLEKRKKNRVKQILCDNKKLNNNVILPINKITLGVLDQEALLENIPKNFDNENKGLKTLNISNQKQLYKFKNKTKNELEILRNRLIPLEENNTVDKNKQTWNEYIEKHSPQHWCLKFNERPHYRVTKRSLGASVALSAGLFYGLPKLIKWSIKGMENKPTEGARRAINLSAIAAPIVGWSFIRLCNYFKNKTGSATKYKSFEGFLKNKIKTLDTEKQKVTNRWLVWNKKAKIEQIEKELFSINHMKKELYGNDKIVVIGNNE